MNAHSPHAPGAHEEPELNNERDLPTEDAHAAASPESVAGEEDPGAALDTEPDAAGTGGRTP